MAKKIICRHCQSPDVVRAGLAEARRVSEKTNKPYGPKTIFAIYKCRSCDQYFPCTDLKDFVS
ncbi:MAG: hypothetical protein JW843_11605 [Candidatus Aminicenantes bacterium]|nr:hypothetical protein [Candidatus Aminicenantes bacterium]